MEALWYPLVKKQQRRKGIGQTNMQTLLHYILYTPTPNNHRLHVIFPKLNPFTNITINIILWIFFLPLYNRTLHHAEKTSYHWKAALRPQTFMVNLCFQPLICVRSLNLWGQRRRKRPATDEYDKKTYMWGHLCLPLIGNTILFSWCLRNTCYCLLFWKAYFMRPILMQ